jgi:hypothetical protein
MSAYVGDLADLVRKYLPRDSDPNITDHVVGRWKSKLEPASIMTLEWD